eukprot:TRINITY_DN2647_c0_g1_i2.p1 TRINITY_DN2647_c0_g1~~TRINITY_DN2647_c0_g1_i2.p1  ORF type:complete len:132 (-),score=19.82 TRINITY_DN2647_c0_g1_i2:250-645(-)
MRESDDSDDEIMRDLAEQQQQFETEELTEELLEELISMGSGRDICVVCGCDFKVDDEYEVPSVSYNILGDPRTRILLLYSNVLTFITANVSKSIAGSAAQMHRARFVNQRWKHEIRIKLSMELFPDDYIKC